MKRLLSLLLAINLSSPAYADCSKPVTFLDQNTPAPCRGYLFTPEKELEVRIMSKEFDIQVTELAQDDEIIKKLTKKNSDYDAILEEREKISELWRAKAIDSTSKYIDSESNRQTRDMIFLGSGVLLTVLAGWALGQVHK